jgi:small subunit ribosomal protein S2
VRNDIHIIDLGKTVPMLHAALNAVRSVVAQNGRILFVGTKRQASEPVAEAAKRCGQYYINQRWLGGLLTNWNTIQASIKRLRKLEENLNEPNIGFTKKELLSMTRERAKLESSLGGIKDMGGRPDLIFIIDTGKEDLAVKEAARLRIPMVAIIDSNCSVDGIDYPIPGNDDSSRAIRLYCRLVSDAVLAGIQESMSKSSVDLGEREDAGEMIPVEGMATDERAANPPASSNDNSEDNDAKKGRNRRGGSAQKKAPVVTVKKTPGKK